MLPRTETRLVVFARCSSWLAGMEVEILFLRGQPCRLLQHSTPVAPLFSFGVLYAVVCVAEILLMYLSLLRAVLYHKLVGGSKAVYSFRVVLTAVDA